MHAIQAIDQTYLVPLPTGQTLMVGAPPEAQKVLVLREYPAPSAVLLPPDPLFADGINQASFEFLLYYHLFVRGGLRDGNPFTVICDPEQAPRMQVLLRHMLHGPSDGELLAWRTPAGHRKQLLKEMAAVSGEVARLPLEQVVRILPLQDGAAELPDGTCIETVPGTGDVRIRCGAESVQVPRQFQSRTSLPLYFADVEKPVEGPRFGLQVIGSASGFCCAEWSSCFIIWINGQPLIIDGTPYLDDHLRRLGIEDDTILGYLITHNHEDHANLFSQLISRRPVTVLTSAPVMCGLVSRMSAILGCSEAEVRSLFRWIPLHPGLEDYGEPLHWFGAEIRTWYSVHTIPTLGVDVSMGGKHIRMPGDTLWGRQLEPLLADGTLTAKRHEFIQHTYDGADVIVADAGGGPIHPDPEEVADLIRLHDGQSRVMVTHIPDAARDFLPPAEPGTVVELLPRTERTPEEAMALFGSPVLKHVPERWLLALLYGGTVEDLPVGPVDEGDDALFVLSGALCLSTAGGDPLPLQRGDLFHNSLVAPGRSPDLDSAARWTRVLRIPEALFNAFLRDTGMRRRLERLYATRTWWRGILAEDLGLDTLVSLSELCRDRTYEPGEDVVVQGDPADDFYIVTAGEVEVLRTNGTQRSVGRFGPGYHFGEIALLAREQRTATVRAVQRTEVLELPGQAFLRHLMGIPLARYRISRLAAQRKRELGPGASNGVGHANQAAAPPPDTAAAPRQAQA
jgi:hypothetical protein